MATLVLFAVMENLYNELESFIIEFIIIIVVVVVVVVE